MGGLSTPTCRHRDAAHRSGAQAGAGAPLCPPQGELRGPPALSGAGAGRQLTARKSGLVTWWSYQVKPGLRPYLPGPPQPPPARYLSWPASCCSAAR